MVKVCIPIIESDLNKALRAIGKANRVADLIELRVDYFVEADLEKIMSACQKPIIVTNRRKEEGGRYQGDERRRVEILREAIDIGASYIDLEIKTKRSLLEEVMNNRKRTRIILSNHNFQGTPSRSKLRKDFDNMVRLGADIIKIVPLARAWEDNLNVLSLLSYAKGRKKEIVAFCMGEKGKMSRVFSPLIGGAWTYASLNCRQSSAPGQLPIKELREILRRLR